jgi:hypothetical protein
VRAAVVGVAALELLALVTIHAPGDPQKPGVAGGIRTAAAQLRGDGPPVDFAQDYVGARAFVHDDDPYPVLTPAYARVGLEWPVPHRSTHPPTAFALALPLARIPWRTAAAVWGFAMLASLGLSWWALGVRPEWAAALAPLTLLWPPAAWSVGQLTAVWLLGLALAWRVRDRPAWAGAAIALASLTKLLPALSLVPFLICRRWAVLRGFALVWAAAVAAIVLVEPGAMRRYLAVVRDVGREQAARGENSGLLWAAGHTAGAIGVVAVTALVLAVGCTAAFRVARLRNVERWSWDGWTWLGVALLPIAWIYSLLPLLPGLLRTAARGGLLARGLAAVAFAIPFTIDPFGLPAGARLGAATACAGLALLALVAVEARRSDRTSPATVSAVSPAVERLRRTIVG